MTSAPGAIADRAVVERVEQEEAGVAAEDRQLAARRGDPLGDALGTGLEFHAADLGARARQFHDESGPSSTPRNSGASCTIAGSSAAAAISAK